MKKIKNNAFNRILYLFSLEKKYVVLLTVLSIFLAATESLTVAMIFPITNIILNGNEESRFLSLLKNLNFEGFSTETMLHFVLLIFLVVAALRVLLFVSNTILLSVFSENLRRTIAVKVVDYCVTSRIDMFSKSTALNVALNESSNVSKIARDSIDIITQNLILISVFTVLAIVDLNLSCAFILIGIIFVLIYKTFLSSYSLKLGKRRLYSSRLITSRIKQVIDGSIDIKTLGASHFAKNYVFNAFHKYGLIIGQINNLRKSPAKFIELLIILIFVTLLIFSERFGTDNKSLVSTLGVFLVGLIRVGNSLANVYGIILSFNNKLPSLDVVFETGLKNVEEPINNYKKELLNVDKIDFLECSGSRCDGPKVKISNFTAKKGRMHAIIGPSGVGKTTLCYVLSGLLRSDDFNVEVNNKRINSQDKFLENIKVVYVPQEPVFFEANLKINLEIGKIKDSEEKVSDLLSRANLMSWVNRFGEIEMINIGDDDINPSGGQIKRLAVIRALMASPQLLIVDEPTSGLDKKSEHWMLELLKIASDRMIVILVTHSDTVINGCDEIYDFQNNDSLLHIN